jgi:hypothetical protein
MTPKASTEALSTRSYERGSLKTDVAEAFLDVNTRVELMAQMNDGR